MADPIPPKIVGDEPAIEAAPEQRCDMQIGLSELCSRRRYSQEGLDYVVEALKGIDPLTCHLAFRYVIAFVSDSHAGSELKKNGAKLFERMLCPILRGWGRHIPFDLTTIDNAFQTEDFSIRTRILLGAAEIGHISTEMLEAAKHDLDVASSSFVKLQTNWDGLRRIVEASLRFDSPVFPTIDWLRSWYEGTREGDVADAKQQRLRACIAGRLLGIDGGDMYRKYLRRLISKRHSLEFALDALARSTDQFEDIVYAWEHITPQTVSEFSILCFGTRHRADLASQEQLDDLEPLLVEWLNDVHRLKSDGYLDWDWARIEVAQAILALRKQRSQSVSSVNGSDAVPSLTGMLHESAANRRQCWAGVLLKLVSNNSTRITPDAINRAIVLAKSGNCSISFWDHVFLNRSLSQYFPNPALEPDPRSLHIRLSPESTREELKGAIVTLNQFAVSWEIRQLLENSNALDLKQDAERFCQEIDDDLEKGVNLTVKMLNQHAKIDRFGQKPAIQVVNQILTKLAGKKLSSSSATQIIDALVATASRLGVDIWYSKYPVKIRVQTSGTIEIKQTRTPLKGRFGTTKKRFPPLFLR